MPVKMKPTSAIKVRLGIEPNGKVQRFTTHTCKIHMDKYLPFDTGTMARTAEEYPNKIIYNQPYAKTVYHGIRNGKEITIHKDKHPLATSYWDKAMVSAEIQDVVKEIQDYINGGNK